MRRRELITLLGGAVAWPFAARAQQPVIPLIGFLHSGSAKSTAQLVATFEKALNDAGFVDGRNVAITFRWADNKYERLPALARELVRLKVAVIVVGGGNVSVLAAKAATSTIPIVFTAATDPIRTGVVQSLSRPGGNVTGIATILAELDEKRLELLGELVPKLGVIGVLVNPARPDAEHQVREIEGAARALGRRIAVLRVDDQGHLEMIFSTIASQRISGLLVASDPLFFGLREKLVALAARHAVPTMYWLRDFAVAGGLISYGTSLANSYRQAGTYVGRILNGAKPAELPIIQSTKFELVINLKTAKALGLTIPPSLVARADEVIE